MSIKLTRSLTEKRKRYVRSVSSRAGFVSPGSIHRNRPLSRTNTSNIDTDNDTNISNSSSEDISNTEIKADYKDYATFPIRRKQTLKTPHPADAETNPNNYMATYSSFPLRQATRVGEDTPDEAASPVSCCDYEDIAQPQINKGGLFDSCILVGMNFSTGEAYIKNVFPEKVGSFISCKLFVILAIDLLIQNKLFRFSGEWSGNAVILNKLKNKFYFSAFK